MGYELVTPLDEAHWPLVHRALEGDGSLALVTYGGRAIALQWTDAPKSPHAEEVSAELSSGVLRVVFHNGTRAQREGVLARLRAQLAAAGVTVTFDEA